MSWEDRLSEAAYRAPSGTRTTFTYRDVSRTVTKNTTGFNSPDSGGTLVQDLGHQGRKYPLRIIFSGDNCDLESDAFAETLLEKGAGVLEHPRYGHVDVVPFGEISQRDDIVTAGNQSVIDVVFWATVGTAYPTVDEDASATALAAVAEFQDVSAQEFKGALKLETQLETVAERDLWTSLSGTCTGALKDVAAASPVTLSEFQTAQKSINKGIDVLISEPLTMAFQTVGMITTPATSGAAISRRLSGYANLLQSIITTATGRISSGVTGKPQVITPTSNNIGPNTLASNKIYTQAAVAGSVIATMSAVQSGEYATQPQALDAAEQLFIQLDDVTNWLDDNYQSLDLVDEGGAYQAIVAAVAYAAGALVSESFNLKRERRITLTRDRGLFDFVAEYYQDLSQIDFFINTNNLSGSDILELPKGKTVVVYE